MGRQHEIRTLKLKNFKPINLVKQEVVARVLMTVSRVFHEAPSFRVKVNKVRIYAPENKVNIGLTFVYDNLIYNIELWNIPILFVGCFHHLLIIIWYTQMREGNTKYLTEFLLMSSEQSWYVNCIYLVCLFLCIVTNLQYTVCE